ncbi:estradiol 17-beta-dehydrogenase 8 [Asbolus verrucosus]|uniref:(3R)-3-hydroxyacyl-CoA dehydrogenase n=1 Tax=Asbolus verrucosus TaxID=1661398 RepID=A0A482VBP0_ASBVE|nr:estradiol 17-beta-dehydrogenase 8 [Asbolus verrucosus]
MAVAGSLIGKLAFVTGAGSGIGRAACKVLAREGASIIAADRNLNSAQETVSNISKESNQNHTSLNINVGDQTSITTALNKILEQHKKPPSIIVNSAGITRDNFLLKLSSDDFDEVININLKGTFMIIQTFSNAIIEHGVQGGSIINIASTSGKYGNVGQANYSASKAGVEGLTRTAAKEFGKFGIRVNCVLPGMIATPMTNAVPGKVKEKFVKVIPLGRFGKPEEVAEVITFLASDKSSYVHGASIDISGGF